MNSDNKKKKLDPNSGDIFDSLSSSPFISGMLKGSTPTSSSEGASKMDLDQLVKSDAISSIFSSVRKGVKTGISAAVKVGRISTWFNEI